MTAPRILLFDSGMGGLTVAQAVAVQLPHARLIYAADNAAFPYGARQEAELAARIVKVMGVLIARCDPHIAVIACNTASTIALAQLREAYKLPFVGTVPAIKPAAAQTKSGMISVLATPGTVAREYTQALIREHASHCRVFLHGAKRLAEMAENSLRGDGVDLDLLRREVTPVFQEHGGKRTDVVVLGCTHYPLLVAHMEDVAPWPVSFLDPAPAIARRAREVLAGVELRGTRHMIPAHGTVLFTSAKGAPESRTAYEVLGFPRHEIIDMPV